MPFINQILTIFLSVHATCQLLFISFPVLAYSHLQCLVFFISVRQWSVSLSLVVCDIGKCVQIIFWLRLRPKGLAEAL